MKKATGYRQEHDSIGERAVPEQAYYGIQTLRAVENFCITRQRTHPALIESMVQVKKAAALANLAAGELDEKRAKAIAAACDEILGGALHDETVCLLSKLNVKHHIEVEITMDELDLTAAESKATYDEIKAYVLEKFGFKVSQLYIAQIKRKCGIIERKNYNQSKKEDAKVPKCPPEKEAAIMDALKHFQMIP